MDQAGEARLRILAFDELRHVNTAPNDSTFPGGQIVVRNIGLLVGYGVELILRGDGPAPGVITGGSIAIQPDPPSPRFFEPAEAGGPLVLFVDRAGPRSGGADGGPAVIFDGEAENQDITQWHGQGGQSERVGIGRGWNPGTPLPVGTVKLRFVRDVVEDDGNTAGLAADFGAWFATGADIEIGTPSDDLTDGIPGDGGDDVGAIRGWIGTDIDPALIIEDGAAGCPGFTPFLAFGMKMRDPSSDSR